VSMYDEMNEVKEVAGYVDDVPLQEGLATGIAPAGNRFGLDLSFLKSETGQGDLADYVFHPLNFNNSKPVARILRGVTGLFGNVNLAIADIMIGIFEMNSKKKDTPKENAQNDDILGNGYIS
jgi:hypothetical protein